MNKKLIGYFIRFCGNDEVPVTVAEIDSSDFLDKIFSKNIMNKIGLKSLKAEGTLYKPTETTVEYVGSVFKEDLQKIQYGQLTIGENEEYMDSPDEETYLTIDDKDIDSIKKYFVKRAKEERNIGADELKYIPLYKRVDVKYDFWWFDYESINKCIRKFETDKEIVSLLKNLSIINDVLYFYNKLDSTREYKDQKTYLLIINK